jgi:hypothetical protein
MDRSKKIHPKNKTNKGFINFFETKHNQEKYDRHGNLLVADRYGEENEYLIYNNVYNSNNIYKEGYLDDFYERVDFNDIYRYGDQTVNTNNVQVLEHVYINNNIILGKCNGIVVACKLNKLLNLGFNNARIAMNAAIKFISKNDESRLFIYKYQNLIKMISRENNNNTRIISFGSKIKNNKIVNKIKCHPDLININSLKQNNLVLEENSTNEHWLVGSLRGVEENAIKAEIKMNYVNAIFIGIGENLYRMDDMPGYFYNHIMDIKDRTRQLKYKSMTSKPDNYIIDSIFTANVFNNLVRINNLNNQRFVIHSTDVAYYISNILMGVGINNITNVTQYHTFNVYSENNFSSNYNFAYIERDGKIIYKPSGNEFPYEHDDVNIFGVKLTKEMIESCFESPKRFDIMTLYKMHVQIINYYPVTKEMSYITIKIEYEEGPGEVIFYTRYNNFNSKMLIAEQPDIKDDVYKICKKTIEKLPDNTLSDKNFEYFKKWIDGEKILSDDKLYVLKETDKYDNGFFIFNDELIFLKSYKNVNDEEVDFDKLNNDKYKYTKYKVRIKVTKLHMNSIINMYRGMSIKPAMIKNAVSSIITLAREDWSMEIDYDIAQYLAILAARYVGKMNQTINKEVQLNKNLYDENIYQEEDSFVEKIRKLSKKSEKIAKETVKVASSVINSTYVNELIETQQLPSKSTKSIINNFKYYFIRIYLFLYFIVLKIKEEIKGLSYSETLFIEHYDEVHKYINYVRKYTKFGTIMKMGQNLFNEYKDKLIKSDLENYHTKLKEFINFYNKQNTSYILYRIFLIITIVPSLSIIIYAIIGLFDWMVNCSLEYDLCKIIFFRDVSLFSRIFYGVIILSLGCINEHFNHGIAKHIIFLIVSLYGSYLIPKFKFVFMLIKLRFINNYSNRIVLLIILFGQLISLVNTQYTDAQYVSKIIYNPGSCTMNQVQEMMSTLFLMCKDMQEYIKKEQLTERIQNKFKILSIRKPQIIHRETIVNKQPLVQKGFMINGYNVVSNEPLKLHDCFYCECEAVYRQVQSKVDYNDDIMENFKEFAHKKLDALLDPHISNIIGFDIPNYLSKLGIKRHEFEQGYLDYQNWSKVILAYKMHVKIDEKIYMNYGKYKMKARNISAQNKRVKLIMGILCEILMDVLHHEEWSGPGSNNYDKCKIFEKWCEEIGTDVGVICADGSAFDSTQHSAIQEIVDNYCFEKLINNCSFLQEIASVEDIKKIVLQQDFTIYSKYFTYKVKGTQMTGRMNTCLGNTLRSWLYVEFIKYNIKRENPKIDINLIKEMVNGDDQIIFMRKKYFQLYQDIAYKYVYAKEDISVKHGLGQIAKIFDLYPEINGAEFLSCILLYDRDQNKFLMVRKIERFLQMTPFTYSNTSTNVHKFRFLNAELLIADAKNILSDQNCLTIYRKYAEKMMLIGQDEVCSQYKYVYNCKNYMKKIKSTLDKYEYVNQFKSYIIKKHQQELLDIKTFDQLYYKFLNEKYGINQCDIDELLNTVDQINTKNYLEKDFRCSIIDKLMNVKNIQQYDDVTKIIDKTKEHVSINLNGKRMMFTHNH